MNNREINPYFELQHGSIVSINDIKEKMPLAMPTVERLIEEGRVVGQRVLSLDGYTSDAIIWMPDKIREREKMAQGKLREIRAELKSIGRGLVFEGDRTLEPGKTIDIE